MVRLGLMGLVVLLAACGNAKLLSSRTPPDETSVIDGPTLAVPPDFHLRPPSDAEAYEAQLRARKTAEAQALITGQAVPTPVVLGSEVAPWLTEQAGAAEGDIRAKLDADAQQKPADEKTFWQRLMGKDK